MKRLFVFLLILYCGFAYGDTQNLTFIVDNETYHTSVCTIGGSVTLPTTPTKTGYDFDGWVAVFNRGTFATWADIPNNNSGYLVDTNGSNIPQENDYIIVNDASNVPEYGDENIEIQVSTDVYGPRWKNYCRTYLYDIDYGCESATVQNGELIILGSVVVNSSWSTQWKSDTKNTMYQGTIYNSGTPFLTLRHHPNQNGSYYAKFVNGYPYSGKWLLRYHGNWNDFGRGGWIAEKQLD